MARHDQREKPVTKECITCAAGNHNRCIDKLRAVVYLPEDFRKVCGCKECV